MFVEIEELHTGNPTSFTGDPSRTFRAICGGSGGPTDEFGEMRQRGKCIDMRQDDHGYHAPSDKGSARESPTLSQPHPGIVRSNGDGSP